MIHSRIANAEIQVFWICKFGRTGIEAINLMAEEYFNP
jgi:hypothetical protein